MSNLIRFNSNTPNLNEGKKFKTIRNTLNLTQEKFAELLNFSRTKIVNIERNKTHLDYNTMIKINITLNEYIKTMGLDFVQDYFVLFMFDLFKNVNNTNNAKSENNAKLEFYNLYKRLSNIDQQKIRDRIEYIISMYDNEDELPTKVIPVIGQTACGNPIEAIAKADDFISTNELKASFALEAKGDSMSPYINDGDLILIKQCDQIQIGEIGIFQINNSGFSDDENVTCKILDSNIDGIITLASINPEYPPIVIDSKKSSIRIIGKYLSKISNTDTLSN